jgi:ribosome-associated protein
VTTSLDGDKAEDIVAIDMAGKSAISDHIVIATGRSQRHVAAMADHLAKRVKENGFGGVTVEGASQGDWVLIDAGDVIIHLFRPEVRDFYGLEKMWGGEDRATTMTVQVGGDIGGDMGGDTGASYAQV